MNAPFLPYGRQEISERDIDAVAAALRRPMITQGPTVAEFEQRFADYVGARHAVAFANGTAALHGAASAAGLQPGAEMLTTPLSFVASSNCARYMGATARFLDIDPRTWNLDAERAAAEVGADTRVILTVSLAGLPADLAPLEKVRDRVVVVEDGCHALGGHRDGVRIGGPGGADMTTFSLHPVKAMTTGEGGMVTTEDDELAARLRTFRTHGIAREDLRPSAEEGSWYYEVRELGFNYRLTDFQCALGLSQLERLDDWIRARNDVASWYRELLAADPRVALPPPAPPGSLHAYHLFVVRVLGGAVLRRDVFEGLRAAGIGVQVHYIPIYRFPYYRDTLGYPQDTCPHAEAYYASAISLPVYPSLSRGDVERVVAELTRLLGSHGEGQTG
ncbi:MAG: DegT/DnrJ/EryC1/StrS aminotransferase [Solirubrobacterales bacterium]|nr:DegT/DnrJ/EryC1/StrS aminotransferase [Solirubrobacterales bacterium]